MNTPSRRAFIAIACAAFLAACAEPLIDAETASSINVRNIVVDTSQITGLSGGREYQVSPDKINADVSLALRQFLKASPDGNTDVAVTVTKVKLVSPGEALLLGGNSYIAGVIKVQSADGTEVLPATDIVGTSQMARLGGVIGAVTSPSPQKDYIDTVTGFATSARDRLLGRK